jgi:hypothetical protein
MLQHQQQQQQQQQDWQHWDLLPQLLLLLLLPLLLLLLFHPETPADKPDPQALHVTAAAGWAQPGSVETLSVYRRRDPPNPEVTR